MKNLSGYSLLILLTLSFYQCEQEESMFNRMASDAYELVSEQYNEKYKDYDENPFLIVAEQPVSTFSVDADGGSPVRGITSRRNHAGH